MKETSQYLAKRLRQEGVKTVAFMQEIPEDHLDVQVYEGGDAWTVRQVCIHVLEAEGSIPRLITRILAGSEGAPKDFDLDRYNESQVRKMGSLQQEEIIKRFSELRRENVNMVNDLNEEDLQVIGRHPFWGKTSVGEMLRAMYMNAKMHMRDIRRVLQKS